MWRHVVWLISTTISEKRSASIFRKKWVGTYLQNSRVPLSKRTKKSMVITQLLTYLYRNDPFTIFLFISDKFVYVRLHCFLLLRKILRSISYNRQSASVRKAPSYETPSTLLFNCHHLVQCFSNSVPRIFRAPQNNGWWSETNSGITT
jgi:hypothetical protein